MSYEAGVELQAGVESARRLRATASEVLRVDGHQGEILIEGLAQEGISGRPARRSLIYMI